MENRTEYMREYRAKYKERAKRVSVTLTPSEHGRARRTASAQGKTLAAFLKDSAFSHMDGIRPVPKELADRVDAMLAVLRGIGNNVNQIARHSNTVRAYVDGNELMLNLRLLDDKLRQFLKSSGSGQS